MLKLFSFQKATILCLSFFSCGMAFSASGDDYQTAAFSLRYPGALSNFNHYADIASKGGASVGSRFGSSANPGSLAWTFPTRFDYGISTMYSNVAFDSGTELNFFTEVLSFDAGEAGVFRLGFGQVTSNERAAYTAIPLEFSYDFSGARLDWSRKMTDTFGFGAGVGYSQSDTVFKAPQFDYSDSSQDAVNFRTGILYSPLKKWFAGIATDYTLRDTDTILKVPSPAGLRRTASNDKTHHLMVHGGIAYEYAPAALLHLDYRWQHLENDTGSLDTHRWMTGADFKVSENLYLRSGAGLDRHGNVSWTAGIGFHYLKPLLIDLAYQDDFFPEIASEFGRSRTLNISLSFAW